MWSKTLTILGIALLALAAGFWWRSQPVSSGDVDAALPVVTTTTLAPTSIPPPTTTLPDGPSFADLIRVVAQDPVVAMPAPVRIRVGGIEVEAPVVPVGIESDGQMEIPVDVAEVGWYSFGPSPGAPGSSVLSGHVSSRSQGRGVFFDLKRLEPGDQVWVEYEDGSSATFEVVGVEIVDKGDLPTDRIFARSGDPVLTLITCGGGFSRALNSYDSNVVVVAVPVSTTSRTAVGGGV
jgi:LPXTG-site transpeptidase (sortase) family protein